MTTIVDVVSGSVVVVVATAIVVVVDVVSVLE